MTLESDADSAWWFGRDLRSPTEEIFQRTSDGLNSNQKIAGSLKAHAKSCLRFRTLDDLLGEYVR
jgi:hypothetical protein